MTKQEVSSLIRKIRGYYPYWNFTEDLFPEWEEHLRPFKKDDLNRKFEEHLHSDNALNPPLLHILTKNLITEEELNKSSQPGEYIVRCNLCGKEMSLSTYDKVHYEKCLLIKSLLIVLEQKGKPTTYEELDKYDVKTLDQVWLKYVPITKTFNW